MNLSSKKCIPCEGEVPPLDVARIAEYLKKLSDWRSIADKKITKKFIFKDFKEALAFVNRAGEIAEREGHHPDIHLVSYKKVIIELSTHAIGGLSENDFIVAAKIDDL